MNGAWWFLLSLILVMAGCQTAHFVRPELLGAKIDDPKFNLITTQQKTTTIRTLMFEKKGVALIFWQRSCPCVKRYQQRVHELYERYGQDLSFVYVSSNNEDFTEVKAEFKKRLIPITLIQDQGGKLAKTLDVRGTPSAALLNDRGELLFMGWIDNERQTSERGRKAYLEDAIKHYLNGQEISVKSSAMFGCKIR